MCVVWWIASWADDEEQYKEEQPREGLFLAGGDELLGGVQSPFSLSDFDPILDPRYSISNPRTSNLQPLTSNLSVGGWSYL